MPGIHVRTFGRLHWENKDKEPILIVPGSYWLCHKNNIYKFTFKFHKTNRSTIDFSYSKELMKIIRRIIKWKPRQGQHFGTKNLLVTYNHASWTRQDKMFAVMKFCDRPDANAFPHAFILTVKILNQEQETKDIMGGSLAKSCPENPKQSIGEDNSSLHNHSLPENMEVGERELVSTESTNSHQESENKIDTSWILRTRSRFKDSDNCIPTNSSLRHSVLTESCVKLMSNKVGNKNCNDEEDTNSNSIEKDVDCNLQNELPEPVKTVLPQQSENNSFNQDENSNSNSGSHSDSSLPYQYLIEKDIERELENSRLVNSISSKENNSINANSPTNSRESSFNNDNDNNDIKNSKDSQKSSKQRFRQEPKDNESMPPPEVANLRSSDITDLVMKGLMFTIRQDKDIVTVVEQKTKLEVDEVLENSEKVETKEGDPCLLNSSLLRLEKMITRMQEPISLPEQKHVVCDNALASFMDLANEINIDTEEELKKAELTHNTDIIESIDTFETADCWSQFFSGKEMSDSTLQNIEKVFEDSNMYINDGNQDKELELKMEDEEEEDIVPEALVHNTFLNKAFEVLHRTSTTEDRFADLLMDDIEPNDEKIVKKEVTEIKTLNQPVNQVLNQFVVNGTNTIKDSSKLPKVISNQVITKDQIPPALLKALKNKSTIQHHNDDAIGNQKNLSENNNEINIKNNEDTIINDTEISVENNIENNIRKSPENEINNSVIILQTERDKDNNVKTCNNSIKNIKRNLRSFTVINNKKTQSNNKFQKNTDTNHSDISNSNSNLVNVRLTRSNSKLYAKFNETLSTSNECSSKQEYSIEIKTQKALEKSLIKRLNKDLNNKSIVRHKRKKSESDKIVSKFRKFVNGVAQKEVKVNVWKLLNDLTFGVKVVVERIDVTNISR